MTDSKFENSRRELMPLIAERFRLLSDAQRLRLLYFLRSGELSVTSLSERVGLQQPSVSKHLKMMHHAGLLERRTEGSQVLYRIADPSIFQLCDLMCNSLEQRMLRQVQQLERLWPDMHMEDEEQLN